MAKAKKEYKTKKKRFYATCTNCLTYFEYEKIDELHDLCTKCGCILTWNDDGIMRSFLFSEINPSAYPVNGY